MIHDLIEPSVKHGDYRGIAAVDHHVGTRQDILNLLGIDSDVFFVLCIRVTDDASDSNKVRVSAFVVRRGNASSTFQEVVQRCTNADGKTSVEELDLGSRQISEILPMLQAFDIQLWCREIQVNDVLITRRLDLSEQEL